MLDRFKEKNEFDDYNEHYIVYDCNKIKHPSHPNTRRYDVLIETSINRYQLHDLEVESKFNVDSYYLNKDCVYIEDTKPMALNDRFAICNKSGVYCKFPSVDAYCTNFDAATWFCYDQKKMSLLSEVWEASYFNETKSFSNEYGNWYQAKKYDCYYLSGVKSTAHQHQRYFDQRYNVFNTQRRSSDIYCFDKQQNLWCSSHYPSDHLDNYYSGRFCFKKLGEKINPKLDNFFSIRVEPIGLSEFEPQVFPKKLDIESPQILTQAFPGSELATNPTFVHSDGSNISQIFETESEVQSKIQGLLHMVDTSQMLDAFYFGFINGTSATFLLEVSSYLLKHYRFGQLQIALLNKVEQLAFFLLIGNSFASLAGVTTTVLLEKAGVLPSKATWAGIAVSSTCNIMGTFISPAQVITLLTSPTQAVTAVTTTLASPKMLQPAATLASKTAAAIAGCVTGSYLTNSACLFASKAFNRLQGSPQKPNDLKEVVAGKEIALRMRSSKRDCNV